MTAVQHATGKRQPATSIPNDSPFRLENVEGYRSWRDSKLARFPASADALKVEVHDLENPTANERAALVERVRRTNMAVYRCTRAVDRESIASFGEALGLHRLDEHLCTEEDGISELRVSEGGNKGDYIPYTDRPLSWHCDGYYNTAEQTIRGMLLHCVAEAAEGGENALLDHELLYIRLRDESPEHIAALMHPETLSIPANLKNGREIRPERTGPVFSVDPASGALHMRYTARTRNVLWREDEPTRAAASRITQLLESEALPVFRLRLRPGEGIVCNNVLHNRTGFRDDPASGRQRLVYRARFFERVAET
jgi:hypothetical protein